MESHAISCYLGIIAFAKGKIAPHAIIPKLHSNPCGYPYYVEHTKVLVELFSVNVLKVL